MTTEQPKQMPLCECGCGERLVWNKWQRYKGIPKVIKGHHLEETRKKISKGNKGKKLSKETRKKLSEVNKGEKNPQYGKKGKKSPNFDRKLSKEHRNKISQSHLGKKHLEETRKKISKGNKGKKLSKETRKKMIKTKEGEKNPMFGKKHSEETRRKIRILTLKYMEEVCGGVTPFLGKNEKDILDELAKKIGYKILRQFPVMVYFLDGYVPQINLAIEVDEPAHKNRIEKDIIRQKEIEQELGCTFLRIKDE